MISNGLLVGGLNNNFSKEKAFIGNITILLEKEKQMLLNDIFLKIIMS